MRKLTLIASLAVAAASMACSTSPSGQNNANASSSAAENVATPSAAMPVAWVNMDTILPNYNMYIDYQAEVEQQGKTLEAELTAKGRRFENEVKDFQDKVQKGLMTRSEAQQRETELGNKQQALLQAQNEARLRLAEEEQVKLRKIHNSIAEYLNKYNADKGYLFIMSYSFGGPLLHGHPSINITTEVLAGLNAEYAASKK
ncbi:MAG: OmpH family outer membrane protein [Bacteroidales bacterium]|nr:OmpH family outer membrane protein [Bacteroidales bacterium]